MYLRLQSPRNEIPFHIHYRQRLLQYGLLDDHGVGPKYSRCILSYRAYRKICQAATDGYGAVDESAIKNAYEFRARFLSVGYWTRKAMVVTKPGRLVSGPDVMQAADKIRIVAGAKVPFIPRRNDEDEGRRLVGECFVYELMEGEVSRAGNLRFDDM